MRRARLLRTALRSWWSKRSGVSSLSGAPSSRRWPEICFFRRMALSNRAVIHPDRGPRVCAGAGVSRTGARGIYAKSAADSWDRVDRTRLGGPRAGLASAFGREAATVDAVLRRARDADCVDSGHDGRCVVPKRGLPTCGPGAALTDPGGARWWRYGRRLQGRRRAALCGRKRDSFLDSIHPICDPGLRSIDDTLAASSYLARSRGVLEHECDTSTAGCDPGAAMPSAGRPAAPGVGPVRPSGRHALSIGGYETADSGSDARLRCA